MYVVEIIKRPNGSHRNHTYNDVVPDGWAVIPENMETQNFPFGDVEVSEINGVMTVTKWTPGEMPVPKAPTPTQQREQTYNTQPIVEWEGEMLTVTQAATKWQYYASEGSTKADELQALIAAAKQAIREQYPDKDASEVTA